MTVNGVMAVILRYNQFGIFFTSIKMVEVRPYSLRQKCSPKNLLFGIALFMVIFTQSTNKECVKERHPHSKATVRLMQHCAAMSAIADFLFSCSFSLVFILFRVLDLICKLLNAR